MNFQSVVMNVADLDRSVDFYRDVFSFTVLSRRDQIAAISAPDSTNPQLIILRALGGSGRVGGARHVGIRALVLEVGNFEEFEGIAERLESKKALVGRRQGPTWVAAVGTDPDRITVVTGCSTEPGPITHQDWEALDEMLYGIGE
jgi:catechol 2,3-dioxygenase-like lactoylglutathione lyase family enzyme